MKQMMGLILATLLTTATLSAHAVTSSLPASAETLYPLDSNPAATEEAMSIGPGIAMPAKAGTPCPCNTKNQVVDQPAMTEVTDDAKMAATYNQLLTGPGTSPIPANSAGGTQ